MSDAHEVRRDVKAFVRDTDTADLQKIKKEYRELIKDNKRTKHKELRKQYARSAKKALSKATASTTKKVLRTHDVGGDETHAAVDEARHKLFNPRLNIRRLKKTAKAVKGTARFAYRYVAPKGIAKRKYEKYAKEVDKKNKNLQRWDHKYTKKELHKRMPQIAKAKATKKAQEAKYAAKKTAEISGKVAATTAKAIVKGVAAIGKAIGSAVSALVSALAPVFLFIFAGAIVLCLVFFIFMAVGGKNAPAKPTDFSETEQAMVASLKGSGLDNAHIAAIIGNGYQESGNTPNLESTHDGENGYPYERSGGIFQWTDCGQDCYHLTTSRLTTLKSYAAQQKAKWDTADVQMKYLVNTYQGQFQNRKGYYTKNCPEYASLDTTFEAWQKAQDVDTATYVFMAGYEGPSDAACNFKSRLVKAKEVYSLLESGGGVIPIPADIDQARKDLLLAAQSQLGVPYKYGAYEPGVALDCSGFTKYCYSQIDIDLPHRAEDQARLATTKSIDTLEPGDLIFWIGTSPSSPSESHVAMYIGNNQIIHANGSSVTISNVYGGYTKVGGYF